MSQIWKITIVVLLTILVGCGPVQINDSNQPESLDKHEKQTEKQPVEHVKDASTEKRKEDSLYADAFDEPVKGIQPEKITIDSIDAGAKVENVGLQEDGQMDVPADYHHAGWYDSGTMPGEQGNAVIAGHVNTSKGKGIFWDLAKLEVGDEVKVSDENGKELVFEVVDVKSFDLDSAPIEEIFGYTSRRNLNLITCTGEFDYDRGTHEQRLVVNTELKE